MDISIETRLDNLESNYSRMADSMHRIARAGEATKEIVFNLKNSLAGYIDDNKNIFIPGYFHKYDILGQRISELEESAKNETIKKKRTKREIFSILKDILIIIAASIIVYQLGFK